MHHVHRSTNYLRSLTIYITYNSGNFTVFTDLHLLKFDIFILVVYLYEYEMADYPFTSLYVFLRLVIKVNIYISIYFCNSVYRDRLFQNNE